MIRNKVISGKLLDMLKKLYGLFPYRNYFDGNKLDQMFFAKRIYENFSNEEVAIAKKILEIRR